MKIALVAGSTGLIGGQLLDLLLNDTYYEKVIALSRKSLSIQHAKLYNLVVDFEKLSDIEGELKCDDVFCCLGTTMKKARSKDAFRKVDYEYPLALAKITKSQGAKCFLLVSALGADLYSTIFYNRVKGETEAIINAVGFESIHIVRPSLLIGPRVEQRSGEDAAKIFYKYFNFLIPQKYKGIESIKVAKAMIAYARQNQPGQFIHESQSLQVY